MGFFNELVAHAGDDWKRATEHRFTEEMVEGSLDKKAFARYLIQDYAFIDSFLNLVSYSIAYSKTVEQKNRLSSFLSMVTSDEDSYFLRSFDALGVKKEEYDVEKVNKSKAIQGFDALIEKAIQSGKYEQCMAVFSCAESVYCEWATRHRDKHPSEFYFDEWLFLHNNEGFQNFVSWLKSEMDRIGEDKVCNHQEIKDIFAQMCRLEAEFFDESLI